MRIGRPFRPTPSKRCRGCTRTGKPSIRGWTGIFLLVNQAGRRAFCIRSTTISVAIRTHARAGFPRTADVPTMVRGSQPFPTRPAGSRSWFRADATAVSAWSSGRMASNASASTSKGLSYDRSRYHHRRGAAPMSGSDKLCKTSKLRGRFGLMLIARVAWRAALLLRALFRSPAAAAANLGGCARDVGMIAAGAHLPQS